MSEALSQSIGYSFHRPELLKEALTHPSYGVPNYQRLEFLGDRVLGLVISDILVTTYGEANEGELSRRFTALVRESTLAEVAESWGLAPHVRLGNGEPMKPAILADVVEALLGAAYVDGGLEAVKPLVEQAWRPYVLRKDEKDPKTRLQEQVQAGGNPLPEYVVVAEEGPDHDKQFTVKVVTALGEAEGQGASKQQAGAAAARALLEKLEG